VVGGFFYLRSKEGEGVERLFISIQLFIFSLFSLSSLSLHTNLQEYASSSPVT